MAQPRPRICVLPYGHRLGWRASRLPLSTLLWPLGVPEGIEGQTLADLLPTDHLLTPPHSTLYFRPTFGTRARVSVMILEPRAIHARHMRLARLFRHRFYRVLTSDRACLATIPNSILFPLAGTWVPQWTEIDLTKRAMCSLIASGKKKQTGHKLRHEVADWIRQTGQDVAVMGGGYQPFKEKSDGLAPFRYSIIIENAREENYFTEKLIDAFLCNTVPIYWGCPNIADFFETGGMLICESMSDIEQAIGTMSQTDYAARLPALAAARTVAVGYADVYARAARLVLDTV